MAAGRVAGRVVDDHVGHGQALAAVDADGLDGRVPDVDVGDGGRAGQGVRGEELGLRLAAVAALAVPPARAVGVEQGPARPLDGDVLSLDLQERAGPFLVPPCRGPLKDDLWNEIRRLADWLETGCNTASWHLT